MSGKELPAARATPAKPWGCVPELSGVQVSIIIATYCPGEAFTRVLDSLDRRTRARDAFEIIVVDGGSPDGILAQVQQAAASRPNMSVSQILNSGWGSSPRNVAIDAAVGEYVFFMDHDDSLYPGALRSLLAFAHQTVADVMSPRESKTKGCFPTVVATLARSQALRRDR